jgi:hypothetical protein
VRRRFCFHDYQLIADGWMVDDFVPRSGQHLSQPATFSRTALTAIGSTLYFRAWAVGRKRPVQVDRERLFPPEQANDPDMDAVTCAEYYRPAFVQRRRLLTMVSGK